MQPNIWGYRGSQRGNPLYFTYPLTERAQAMAFRPWQLTLGAVVLNYGEYKKIHFQLNKGVYHDSTCCIRCGRCSVYSWFIGDTHADPNKAAARFRYLLHRYHRHGC